MAGFFYTSVLAKTIPLRQVFGQNSDLERKNLGLQKNVKLEGKNEIEPREEFETKSLKTFFSEVV